MSAPVPLSDGFGLPAPTPAPTPVAAPAVAVPPGGDDSIAAVVTAVRREVQDLVDGASPTPDFLRKLGDSLMAAQRTGDRPAVVDPDRFWTETLWPRARELGSKVEAILARGMTEIRGLIVGIESEMTGWAKQMAWEASASGAVAEGRVAAIDAIAERLESLHDAVAVFAGAGPDSRVIDSTRAVFHEHLTRASHDAVRKERRPYLAAAGPDPQAQRLAELQWDALVPDRLTQHQAAVRAQLPWRHQEMSLHAMAEAVVRLCQLSQEMAERLTAPLFPMGERVVLAFDDALRHPGR